MDFPAVAWGDVATPSRMTRLSRVARVARTALTALVWLVGRVPGLVGHARCAVVVLFHRPCPGCGMTRAVRLLFAGRVGESLAMHPFAAPVVIVGVWVALGTMWAAYSLGSPFLVWRTRF